jgi:hypothetical protein
MRFSSKWLVLSIATLLSLTTGLTTSATQANAQTQSDARVKASLDKLGYKYEVDKDGDFKMTMRTGDARTQLLFVKSKTEKLSGLEIREIFSPGYLVDGEISGEIAKQLLMDNSAKKIGAWQIQGSAGKKLAIFVVQIPAGMSGDDFRAAIDATALAADMMESKLTNKDDF